MEICKVTECLETCNGIKPSTAYGLPRLLAHLLVEAQLAYSASLKRNYNIIIFLLPCL